MHNRQSAIRPIIKLACSELRTKKRKKSNVNMISTVIMVSPFVLLSVGILGNLCGFDIGLSPLAIAFGALCF